MVNKEIHGFHKERDIFQLTEREKEIVRALIAGVVTTKALAETLSMSEGRVCVHMSNILQKLGVKNRRELITKFEQEQQT